MTKVNVRSGLDRTRVRSTAHALTHKYSKKRRLIDRIGTLRVLPVLGCLRPRASALYIFLALGPTRTRDERASHESCLLRNELVLELHILADHVRVLRSRVDHVGVPHMTHI